MTTSLEHGTRAEVSVVRVVNWSHYRIFVYRRKAGNSTLPSVNDQQTSPDS